METVIENRASVLPNAHIEREPIIDACDGCNKVFLNSVCIAYANPKAVHRRGCVLKSNKIAEIIAKKKINPLKASKRARTRGK